MLRPTLFRTAGRRTRLLTATVATVAGLLAAAPAALATTDHFLTSSYISSGALYAGSNAHYNVLVYGHNLQGGGLWMGAAVSGCYNVAHAYDEVTHSYGTPCNSLPYIENDSPYGFTANGHANY
jgi:hypothetical protein